MTDEAIHAAAAAIANVRAGRRGCPPISNVLELMPPELREQVIEDAKAALEAAMPKLDKDQLSERIRTMQLLPGDTLVIEHPGVLSAAARNSVTKEVQSRLEGVNVLVLDSGARIGGVLRPGEGKS